MTHIPGPLVNNSVATMFDLGQSSYLAPPSSDTNLSTPTVAVSLLLHKQDLTQAFSQALGNLLPQILAALQSHSTSSGSTTQLLVECWVNFVESYNKLSNRPQRQGWNSKRISLRVVHEGTDNVINRIMSLGRGTLLRKLECAYHNFPVYSDDLYLLHMKYLISI